MAQKSSATSRVFHPCAALLGLAMSCILLATWLSGIFKAQLAASHSLLRPGYGEEQQNQLIQKQQHYTTSSDIAINSSSSSNGCTCLVEMSKKLADISSRNGGENKDDNVAVVSCDCKTGTVVVENQAECKKNENGADSSRSVQKEQGKYSKSSRSSENGPWYATDRVWHYPVKFPRCTMDACFNYTPCSSNNELQIYSYPHNNTFIRYFEGLDGSRFHTTEPDKACIFMVFLDTTNGQRIEPQKLEYWNDGLNHILVTFADMWNQRGPPPERIGKAAVMASDLHQTTSRPGFDISITLPPHHRFRDLHPLLPFQRRYFLTFKGLRYFAVGMASEGVFRSHDSFRQMHNGGDIVVATSCRHPVNDEHRRNDPALGAHCDDDNALYDKYNYADLMNSTFALVPAGISPNSYRLGEALSAGAIPVLIADNYVKPFEPLVPWHRCALQFPTTEIHMIVPVLRSIKAEDVAARQRQCLVIYESVFRDDSALLGASIAALKARFMGSVPSAHSGIGSLKKR